MKGFYININAKIKMMLGICCSSHCYKRATMDVFFNDMSLQRCLCDKHFDDLERLNLR